MRKSTILAKGCWFKTNDSANLSQAYYPDSHRRAELFRDIVVVLADYYSKL
jgi:hypothetical protein